MMTGWTRPVHDTGFHLVVSKGSLLAGFEIFFHEHRFTESTGLLIIFYRSDFDKINPLPASPLCKVEPCRQIQRIARPQIRQDDGVYEEYLAVPVIKGKKSEKEKFAGASTGVGWGGGFLGRDLSLLGFLVPRVLEAVQGFPLTTQWDLVLVRGLGSIVRDSPLFFGGGENRGGKIYCKLAKSLRGEE